MFHFRGIRYNPSLRIFAVIAVLLLSINLGLRPAEALVSGSMTLSPSTINGGPAIYFEYPVTANSTGDGDNYDWFVIALFDCNGHMSLAGPDAILRGTSRGGGMIIPIASFPYLPIKGKLVRGYLFDVDIPWTGYPDSYYQYAFEHGRLMGYDDLNLNNTLGTSYPDCVTGFPDFGNPETPGESPIHDDRINKDPGAIVAIYAPEADGIKVYGIHPDSQGTLTLYVTQETLDALPEKPDTNIEVATSTDGIATLYKLTTGEYQLNAGPDGEGKVFVYIFTLEPPEVIKYDNFNVNGDG